MSVTCHSSRQRRRRNSSLRCRKLRTGCTPTRARTRPSLRMSHVSTRSRSSATRSPSPTTRQSAIAQLRETLNNYMSQATSGDEKYAHIDEKDKQSVVEKVATVQKWLEDQIVRQAESPKNVEPVLKTAEIGKKRDDVIYFAT